MTVQQLSVFIENKSGTLIGVLNLLKDKGIKIIASTIADTAEYGICRMICNDPAAAYEVLRNAGIAASLCEVFAIALDDSPGKTADTIAIFAQEGISIAYLYSFILSGKGVLFFRTDNAGKAREVIRKSHLEYITDLSTL